VMAQADVLIGGPLPFEQMISTIRRGDIIGVEGARPRGGGRGRPGPRAAGRFGGPRPFEQMIPPTRRGDRIGGAGAPPPPRPPPASLPRWPCAPLRAARRLPLLPRHAGAVEARRVVRPPG
jgi:hypothetical protein